jgi:hypothetical protein
MVNRLKLNNTNLLAAALGIVACSSDAARKEASSDVAPAGAGSTPSSSAPAIASGRYIGVRHGPLPSGISSQGGAVLRIDGAEYAFTSVRTPTGDMVWLDSIAPGASQTPVKIVRAELRVPPLARDERLLMASCDVDGRLDPRVVAIVVNETNATKLTKVRQAWRADARNGRFDVIPVAGITCEDPGTTS